MSLADVNIISYRMCIKLRVMGHGVNFKNKHGLYITFLFLNKSINQCIFCFVVIPTHFKMDTTNIYIHFLLLSLLRFLPSSQC